MDACIENHKRNGIPSSTKPASRLRIKEVVQKEVLVLPPSKKRTRKTAMVAGRLLTKYVLDAIAGPSKKPRKATKSKKVPTTPKLAKDKKQKKVNTLGTMQRGDVVWEAIV
ncbi:hypothetical protein PR003_g1523 [Phytophthora rubi]|uniref:Uncharacterized protein n=1 Tax=Phytophthora rubi TaxID=129364 RepID=A0A6A4FV78_9STRA|nr:hypothetical protein PR002_g996 [Phytophthora rubi]KAE9051809.1 hypothetical protein PR001_g1106 [Phytophthora rubi]KAE9358016.1 hypothetical protein PR003_g1523 [Phytophthora rubi]